ncbi:hypothetical protein ACLB2K_063052 [Fragaria x ananassa]
MALRDQAFCLGFQAFISFAQRGCGYPKPADCLCRWIDMGRCVMFPWQRRSVMAGGVDLVTSSDGVDGFGTYDMSFSGNASDLG